MSSWRIVPGRGADGTRAILAAPQELIVVQIPVVGHAVSVAPFRLTHERWPTRSTDQLAQLTSKNRRPAGGKHGSHAERRGCCTCATSLAPLRCVDRCAERHTSSETHPPRSPLSRGAKHARSSCAKTAHVKKRRRCGPLALLF